MTQDISSGFRVLFECVSNGIAHVRVEANVSTADRFCVLRFAFGKDCGLEGMWPVCYARSKHCRLNMICVHFCRGWRVRVP